MTDSDVSFGSLLATAAIGVVAALVAVYAVPMLGAGSTTTASVDYNASFKCQDHEAQNGEYIHECTTQVVVDDLGNAEYVEVRTVDGISHATKIETIYNDENGAGVARISEDGDSELQYWDVVIIEAVLESGETVVLEQHEFSCEDVYYKEACDDGE